MVLYMNLYLNVVVSNWDKLFGHLVH